VDLRAPGGGVAALLWSPGDAALWLFVALFGAGFGAITPARAALVAELYGRARYGSVSGVLALVLALARAAAPVGASLLYAAWGGYESSRLLAALSLIAAGAVLAAAPSPHDHPIPAPAP
jgi:MFS family permease